MNVEKIGWHMPTRDNPAAALRPEAVLRAILRPGAPAPRGTAPASPAAAAAATAADVAAADGGRSHDKPAATVPAPATAAPTDDDASATTVDDGAHADHSTSDDAAAKLCYPGTVGVPIYCATSFFHLSGNILNQIFPTEQRAAAHDTADAAASLPRQPVVSRAAAAGGGRGQPASATSVSHSISKFMFIFLAIYFSYFIFLRS